ncbi:MAG: heme exporter protein CcmB [Methylococcales bacterium]|jgi:heme exporter protein B|nr:heme exporter protein CcmB [Methylococcales bacterium]
MKQISAVRAFWWMIKRDIVLSFRHKGELINPLLFFVLVIMLFPLGMGIGQTQLATISNIAPGLIWVTALLASMLSLEGIFRSDFEDGTLDMMVMGVRPVALLALAKVIAHWMVTGIPIIIIAPLMGLMLGLKTEAYGALMLTLLMGTPLLSLIGAIGVALTVGLRGGGVILSLLILPLYVPVLIFSANLVAMASIGEPITAHLYMLSGMLVLAVSLAPWAIGAALKISVS